MKTALIVALIALTPTLAFAETELADWQKAGLEKVREYSRVKNAEWQSETLLWLFADPADVAWDTVADQMTCNQLRAAGMPEGRRVMVAFYNAQAAAQMKADRMGYAICK